MAVTSHSGISASDTWQGDACSLVDAFRAGERSPVEELDATYAAIEVSNLNAFGHLDRDRAYAAARNVDVNLPFGGIPIGVKELDQVAGWPDTEACVALSHMVSDFSSVMVQRLEDAGVVLVGQTTASEFGGVNVTRTVMHGATHNPWEHGRTPGGSSGGSAAAVAGGIVTLATAGDGGGSIRIPAGFTGLVGLKATYGRIPRAPKVQLGNLTTVTGCVTRSVRDTARWFDVTSGHDPRDPLSLPSVGKWEPELGSFTQALRGLRVAIVPDWGGAVVSPAMWKVLSAEADQLIAEHGWKRVDIDTSLPSMGAAWSISGMLSIHAQLGDLWPACAGVLTPEISFGLASTVERYGPEARARIESRRTALNERMAEIFNQATGVDLVLTASNPDIAFDAEGPLPAKFGGLYAGAGNNGRLTFPANLHGNPAISIPAGFVDGLPVGLQVVSRHFTEQLLLDIALHVERNRPWPLVTL
ncbi:MAG: amidase [Actinomycetota bacterium]|nr:amidase [Actinomycetota bacterium]MDA3018764.1 amidase [Actinomycetota bacterium]